MYSQAVKTDQNHTDSLFNYGYLLYRYSGSISFPGIQQQEQADEGVNCMRKAALLGHESASKFLIEMNLL